MGGTGMCTYTCVLMHHNNRTPTQNVHPTNAQTTTQRRWLLAGGPVDALWERDPQELVRQLEACIKVCAVVSGIHGRKYMCMYVCVFNMCVIVDSGVGRTRIDR